MNANPLAVQLEAAVDRAREMDVSLGERLDYVARAVRSLSTEFADGVDHLIERLRTAGAGAEAPQVGEKMPSFGLPDASGNYVRLEEELEKGPVAVVFNRGHWCPYCRLNTGALALAQHRLGRASGILAITPDRSRFASMLKDETHADFPVLTDIDNGYAMSLNLVFWVGDEMRQLMTAAGYLPSPAQGNDAWFLPIPATFVVDTDGTVRARFIDPDYRKRMAIEDLMEALQLPTEQ
jgi:peroxiredoxin